MKEEILKFFKGDAEDSEATLDTYSRDASVFYVRPELVLYPRDVEDIKNLVKWVAQNKDLYVHPGNTGKRMYITPRAAGTDMSGGALGESIVLDFTRYMNKLVGGPLPLKTSEYWEVAVQPGMFYRDFEKITSAKRLILPCYTASKNINAMGGMFGNNSAGERTLKYGQMARYVMSSKVIFTDGNEYEVKPLSQEELEKKISQNDFEGNVYKKVFNLIKENEEDIKHAKPKVSKNSAGYYIWNVWQNGIFDLNQVLVGSQGTLGIVTEMTLKLIPENKHSKLVAISTDDLVPLGRLVEEILTLHPETLETYDDKTMKLAVKFFPDFLKNKGLFGMLQLFRSFMPEFLMTLRNVFGRGRIPKLVILAEFAGEDEKELEIKCEELREKIKHFNVSVHITRTDIEANKYWNIRRESFALLRKHVKGMRTAPFIDDIIVRPEFLPKFLPELNDILAQYKDKIVYTLAGHAGDGNFHIIPLMDFHRADTGGIILELAEKVFDLVAKYRGSMAGEHNDGLIRTPYLGKMYGEKIISIFATIKNIFDSKSIFNPGKKVPAGRLGGTKEYLASHIALEHDAKHTV